MNLISNALKFSKSFDIIVVRLKLTSQRQSDECSLIIEVVDTGVGISEEEQLKLFTPYFKTYNPKSLAKN